MNNYESLLTIIITKDRLEFLKFRHKYINRYGYDKFKILLDKVTKDLE